MSLTPFATNYKTLVFLQVFFLTLLLFFSFTIISFFFTRFVTMADYTISGYIASAKSLSDKITVLDTLIDSMLIKMAESVDTSDTISYRLDTGQMVINQEFRSISDLSKSINDLEVIKQTYVNRLNGRVTIMRGGSNHRYRS